MLILPLIGDAAAATLSTLACVDHAGPDLVDHAVPVVVDTAAWIGAGELDPDCADLRVTDLAGTPLPFWVEDATCDSSATTVWVALASVPAGPTSVVVVRSDVPVGVAGDGDGVFPLFEDFSDLGSFTDWVFRGGGEGELVSGVLETTAAPVAMYSVDAAFLADTTALIARVDAAGGGDDDFEIGGGVIAPGPIWRADRDWYGFTHLTWDGAYYTVSDASTPGQSCHDAAYGAPWLPVVGQDPRAWHRLEVRYDSAGGSTLTLDADPPIVRPGAATCVPEPALPVLLVLDHSDSGENPTQKVDFLFVRPTADPEPTVTVVAEDDPDLDGVPSAVEGCGDEDGDGAPNWDDAPDPPVDTGLGGSGGPGSTTGGSGGGPDTGPIAVDTGGAGEEPGSTGSPSDRSPAGVDGGAVGCGCQPGVGPGVPGGWLGIGLLVVALVRPRWGPRPGRDMGSSCLASTQAHPLPKGEGRVRGRRRPRNLQGESR